MLTQFFTIGILMLLSAMLPGPDFACVTKNSILYSRRAGIFTSIGITSAVMIHITYCIYGLAIIISRSILLFNMIKYIGAIYLIYLGITSLLLKHTEPNSANISHQPLQKTDMSDWIAFRQGFFCNILNPKATLFFLAVFTMIIKPNTPIAWEIAYAIEMLAIVLAWFCSLTLLLSHPRVLRLLNRVERYIAKILGVFLIGFGVALFFVKR